MSGSLSEVRAAEIAGIGPSLLLACRCPTWTLIDTSDILIGGLRPSVMEKLGLGPNTCLSRNQQLVCGRMSG